MQCTCGLETKPATQIHNKGKHKLDYQRCECGKQGGYVYYWNGEPYSRGLVACQDFAIAKADNL